MSFRQICFVILLSNLLGKLSRPIFLSFPFSLFRNRSDEFFKNLKAKLKGENSHSRVRGNVHIRRDQARFYTLINEKEISMRRHTLSSIGHAGFRITNVLTEDISWRCIVAMIRPCSEPSGKRVTVNRIHEERERRTREEEVVCRYHRRVSMPGLPIVLYNTFTLRPIIILYSGCIVFLSGIMFRRHARPRPGA